MMSNTEQLHYDVVVIGGGTSGLSAAWAAANAGAKVLLLERRNIVGGTGSMIITLFGLQSPTQKRLGIQHTVDELYTKLLEASHYQLNARLLRKFLMRSGDTIQWIEQDLGLKFNTVRTVTGTLKSAHAFGGDDMTGLTIIKKLQQELQDKGVDIMMGTRAKRLVRDNHGNICGVIAIKNDQEFIINTKAAIVCTGTITGNPELMKKHFPQIDWDPAKVRLAVRMEWNSGDGQCMTQEIGASSHCTISRHNYGPDNQFSGRAIVLTHRPEMMTVNKHGLRFIDESITIRHDDHSIFGSVLEDQPNYTCYAIMDEKNLQEMMRQKKVLCMHDEAFGNDVGSNDPAQNLVRDEASNELPPAPPLPSTSEATWMRGLAEHIQQQAKDGHMLIANTLEEVAAWIGCNASVLKNTVSDYNGFCREGYDGDFLKPQEWLWSISEAPYYVFVGTQGTDSCPGGIKINHNGEVVDDQQKPIGGLYAGGTGCSGIWGPGSTGDGYTLGGAFAFFTGQMSGENAAHYIKNIMFK